MKEQVAPIRVVKNMRPLYFHDGQLYCARFNKLFRTNNFGKSLDFVADFNARTKLSGLFKLSNLAQRILRMMIYRLRVLANGNIVFTFKGGIYTLRPAQKHAELTFKIIRGSRPVSLAYKPNGLLVFGEYFSNQDRNQVFIFGSKDFGMTWQKVYTFESGTIRHIHGISYDQWEDCFWILTGDYDHENRLIRASADFSDLRTVLQGGQKNRFYSVLVERDYLVTATDTPLEDNQIVVIQKKGYSCWRNKGLENSSFYSCKAGKHFFISTNAEPSQINDTKHSHVWVGTSSLHNWKRILSFPVDFLSKTTVLPGVPKGLFQFPRIFFPDGQNDSDILVCHGIGVKKYSNSMVCYKISDLERLADEPER
jgi:hypothetical protein